jgi:hypothetical protein
MHDHELAEFRPGGRTMPSEDRINTLWRLVRASSDEGRRTRRRLAASAALTVLMSGLLTAIGLAIVVLGFAAVVLVVVGGPAARRTLRVYWPLLRSRGGRIAPAIRRRAGMVLALARTSLTHIRRLALSVLASFRLRGPRLAKASADHVAHVRRRLATSGAAMVTRMRGGIAHIQNQRLSNPTPPVDLHREAVRLNASGTQHRRNGAHAQAVSLHRRALEILEGLGDRRAAALTQNNLALALSHIGDDRTAIAFFEEAAATLRELGEQEHEGRIIANLGFAHRRRGRYDESEHVLQLALTKLTPASGAYEAVAAELRRAS